MATEWQVEVEKNQGEVTPHRRPHRQLQLAEAGGAGVGQPYNKQRLKALVLLQGYHRMSSTTHHNRRVWQHHPSSLKTVPKVRMQKLLCNMAI